MIQRRGEVLRVKHTVEIKNHLSTGQIQNWQRPLLKEYNKLPTTKFLKNDYRYTVLLMSHSPLMTMPTFAISTVTGN